MTSSRLPAGYRLREYEIVRTLGQGSFGITYLAYDHRLDGPVALKEYFPAEWAVRENGRDVASVGREHHEQFAWGLRRFLDEARTVYRFSHPNVVRAHRYFESRGTAYIVMEYAEGKSLGQILAQRRPLRPEEWQPLLADLLAGLEHVHRNNYLHRDIKPANIIIRDTDGQPVLVDFGSARIASGERTRTVVLTQAYAPIEQHSARAKQGPYTDIYALAAVSFRALTGSPPAPAPDRMLSDGAMDWTGMRSPGDWANWIGAIQGGLERRPTDRPQTVADWRSELDEGWAGSDGSQTESSRDGNQRTVVPDERSRRGTEVSAGARGQTVVADRVSPGPQAGGETSAAIGIAVLAGVGLLLYLLMSGDQPHTDPQPAPSSSPLIGGPAAGPGVSMGDPAEILAPGVRSGPSPPEPVDAIPPDPVDGMDRVDSLLVLTRNAEQGDRNAQFALAMRLLSGEGVEADSAKAAEWYRRAGIQGHVGAQFMRGRMLDEGWGVTADDAEAVEWYRRAADQGHVEAQFALGAMLYEGQGTAADPVEAVEWYRRAADQGYADAQLALGVMLFEGEGTAADPVEAAEWFKRAADQGDVEAQAVLGATLYSGEGTAADPVEAAKWFRRAADQGHVEAQFALGAMLDGGEGVAADPVEASEWYRRAGSAGNVRAQFRLGRMLDEGWGVTADDAKAVEWYRRAGDQGHVEAQFALGLMLHEGEGVAADPVEAAEWYRRAAIQGHVGAQFMRGRMLDEGWGVTANDSEAVEWYRRAADEGHVEAQFALGLRLYWGEGVGVDHVEAAEWYRRAGSAGHANAQFWLGRMLDEGWGVTADDTMAVEWYRRAAEQGDADAQAHLARMLLAGGGVALDRAEGLSWLKKAADQRSGLGLFLLAERYEIGRGVPSSMSIAVDYYRQAASQASVDAWYRLGVMRREGRGMGEDRVLAHMWFSLAETGGYEAAGHARAELESGMTASMIGAARELSSVCFRSNYHRCGRPN